MLKKERKKKKEEKMCLIALELLRKMFCVRIHEYLSRMYIPADIIYNILYSS